MKIQHYQGKIVLRIFFCTMITLLSMEGATGQDTLNLNNGNVLYGEIKSLNKSVLTLETGYSDSDFKIEWDKVLKMHSTRQFRVFLSSREKLYAYIKPGTQDGHVILINEVGSSQEVNINEVVMLDPIEDSFTNRFKASVSAGLTLTKANNSKQFSSRASVGYTARSWNLSANINDTRSTQDNVDPIARTDGSVNFNYLFYRNWFAAYKYDFLSNTEQQIDIRGTQTLAIGNMLIRNNKLYLSASGGITFNREDYTNEAEIYNTSEGFLGTEFNAYDIGDLDFLTRISYYPSFTETNRHRVNFSADLKYEFPLDFFIKVGYTLNYDSKPQNEGANQDYMFQTTLGWEF